MVERHFVHRTDHRTMTEQGSSAQDPSELTTTAIAQQTATGSSVTSSWSRGAYFYFQCAVVVIGIIGTAANALIIYALVASKQYKKHLLIINQNALDLVSCVFLVITYTAKLCNVRLTGSSGFWFCATILSEAFVWWGILGSKIGLAAITIDRYLKIVHAAKSKKILRKGVIYSTMVFMWIVALVYSLAVNFNTTAVINGACYAAVIWKSRAVKMAHGIWNFLSFYVVILAITVFCYWRILTAIRRHANALSNHGNPGPSTASVQSHTMQMNVIKTMIVVSAFFAITNFPVDFYFLLVNVGPDISLLEGGYYVTMFIMFLYSCTNPFIYAVKFDPVKTTLLGLVPCKNSVHAT